MRAQFDGICKAAAESLLLRGAAFVVLPPLIVCFVCDNEWQSPLGLAYLTFLWPWTTLDLVPLLGVVILVALPWCFYRCVFDDAPFWPRFGLIAGLAVAGGLGLRWEDQSTLRIGLQANAFGLLILALLFRRGWFWRA